MPVRAPSGGSADGRRPTRPGAPPRRGGPPLRRGGRADPRGARRAGAAGGAGWPRSPWPISRCRPARWLRRRTRRRGSVPTSTRPRDRCPRRRRSGSRCRDAGRQVVNVRLPLAVGSSRSTACPDCRGSRWIACERRCVPGFGARSSSSTRATAGSGSCWSSGGRSSPGRCRLPVPPGRDRREGRRLDAHLLHPIRVDPVPPTRLAVAPGREERADQAEVRRLVVRRRARGSGGSSGSRRRRRRAPAASSASRRVTEMYAACASSRSPTAQSSYGSSSRKSPPYRASAVSSAARAAGRSPGPGQPQALAGRLEEHLDVELHVRRSSQTACLSPPTNQSGANRLSGSRTDRTVASATDSRLASGSGSSSGQSSSNSVSRVVGPAAPRRRGS